ncbi:MAG: exodeoxyribonuclease VII large subunit [Anaerovoracaceae bacterium]|jgi:exodeoxyribonuclease VII large subunit
MAIKPVKVSQLNGYIGRILSTYPLLGNVTVIGEISNLKYHSSGHVYFSLKDERSRISCFLSAAVLPRIRYELEEGMEIIIAGSISVYERGGYYSLNVRDIEVEGQGDLAVAFEKLKKKLQAEGLFDASRKKPIPEYPRRVAVITAETGAAVRDIMKIITGKNKVTDVILYPVLVQGPRAAAEIAAALRDINEQKKTGSGFTDVDTIICGRGGGSMEDLWAFNEEVVARAIADSEIPVISAVGHETDVTIADFAADYRAETPTAAADKAVPDTARLRQYIDDIRNMMLSAIERKYDLMERRLAAMNLDIFGRMIERRLDISSMRAEKSRSSLENSLMQLLTARTADLELARSKLEGSSPERIMSKGYAALTDEKGSFLRSIADLEAGDKITITGHDARARAAIEEVEKR